jgi:hypothetical protein
MASDPKELTLKLNKLDLVVAKRFTKFFADFDKGQTLNSLGVESYKVQVTSLEDIFNK